MILTTEVERVRWFDKGLIIPIHLKVSQVVVFGVLFVKVVDVENELEMIQCEGVK